MIATLLRDDGKKRTYLVPEIGHVAVYYIEPRSPNNPSDRPWHLINWGTTHETPDAAVAHAIESWNRLPTPAEDRAYERMEALMCGPGRFELD